MGVAYLVLQRSDGIVRVSTHYSEERAVDVALSTPDLVNYHVCTTRQSLIQVLSLP